MLKLSGRFFQIFVASQNIWALKNHIWSVVLKLSSLFREIPYKVNVMFVVGLLEINNNLLNIEWHIWTLLNDRQETIKKHKLEHF